MDTVTQANIHIGKGWYGLYLTVVAIVYMTGMITQFIAL